MEETQLIISKVNLNDSSFYYCSIKASDGKIELKNVIQLIIKGIKFNIYKEHIMFNRSIKSRHKNCVI